MYDDIAEITKVVGEKEATLSALRTRMERHYDLYTLVPYESEDANGKVRAGYQAYTSTGPRNFFDKVLDGLNRASLTIQIQLPEDAPIKERDAASRGELFLFGAFQEIDRRQNRRGEPPFREALGFFMCLRGWFCVRALVYMPKGGKETVFDVQAWDPLQVTWEQGNDGLLWAARKRTATKGQIESEYGLVIKGKEAEVLDFFDQERNSVIIEGTFAKKPVEHKIGHVPILIGAVGSMPTIQGQQGETTIEYQGDSVWAAAESLYKPFNKHISWLMDAQARSIAGSLVVESETGEVDIKGDPYATFRTIPLKRGDSIKPLELPKAPPEAAALLSIISQDIQQSSLPYPLAYGGTREAMSGRALSMLQDNTRSVYTPRTGAMARAFTWISEELLGQYAKKGLRPSEFRGTGRDGKFFQAKIKPSEVNPEWFVSIIVEPKLPRDQETEIMMARMATEPRGPDGSPLLSDDTVLETILLVRDPSAEEGKKLVQMGKRLKPIMVAETAKALKKAGEDEMAEEVLVLQGGSGPGQPGSQAATLPPELLRAIVEVLVGSGQPQLAEAMLKALGVIGPGQALGSGGVPPQVGAPAEGMMPGGEMGPGMPPGGMPPAGEMQG